MTLLARSCLSTLERRIRRWSAKNNATAESFAHGSETSVARNENIASRDISGNNAPRLHHFPVIGLSKPVRLPVKLPGKKSRAQSGRNGSSFGVMLEMSKS